MMGQLRLHEVKARIINCKSFTGYRPSGLSIYMERRVLTVEVFLPAKVLMGANTSKLVLGKLRLKIWQKLLAVKVASSGYLVLW